MVKKLAVLLAILLLAGCGSTRFAADISEYGDTPITVAGLTNAEFTVTPNELSKLDCVVRSAAGATEKAGTVSGIGPLLDTFLAQYGRKQTDFELIRFIASDAYRITLHEKTLTGSELILILANGKKPLPQNERPLRLLIPGAESSQWIYAIERIEFELLEVTE